MCVKIGEELLSETLTNYKRKTDMVLRTIEVFIVALAVYEQIMKRKSKDDSKTNENESLHLLVLDARKEMIGDWLRKLIFIPYDEKDLKVLKVNKETKKKPKKTQTYVRITYVEKMKIIARSDTESVSIQIVW